VRSRSGTVALVSADDGLHEVHGAKE
jgi:hypothetical protein